MCVFAYRVEKQHKTNAHCDRKILATIIGGVDGKELNARYYKSQI